MVDNEGERNDLFSSRELFRLTTSHRNNPLAKIIAYVCENTRAVKQRRRDFLSQSILTILDEPFMFPEVILTRYNPEGLPEIVKSCFISLTKSVDKTTSPFVL